MATEVGVAYVRLLPTMEGFSRDVGRTLERELGDLGEDLGRTIGEETAEGMSRALEGEGTDVGAELAREIEAALASLDVDIDPGDEGTEAGRELARELEAAVEAGMEGVGTDVGRELGDEAAAALRQGDGMDAAGAEAGGKFGVGLKEKIVAGVAIAGAAAGAALVDAFSKAIDQNKATTQLGAQLGLSPDQAKKAGKTAGQVYVAGFGEEFGDAAALVRAAMSKGLLPVDATQADVKKMSKSLGGLSETWGLEADEIAKGVKALVNNSMVKDAGQGVDFLAKAFQGLSDNEASELLETFSEYGAQFKRMGIDGPTAFNLMRQGVAGGARDFDRVGDALHEIPRIIQEEWPKAEPALKQLGLNADQIKKAFAEGGPAARDATDQIIDGLRNVKDPADRAAIAIELMGDVSGELGDGISKMDLTTASKDMGNFAGEAERLGTTLHSGAGANLKTFKRELEQNVVEFLGGTVIPKFQELGKSVSKMWDEAGKGGASGPDKLLNFFEIMGDKLGEKLKTWGPKVIEGLTNLGESIAEYLQKNPDKVIKMAVIAAAIATAFATLPQLLFSALLTTANTIMAGFADNLKTKTEEKLSGWWDSTKQWFSDKATGVGDWFSDLGTGIADWFSGLWPNHIEPAITTTWDDTVKSAETLPYRIGDAIGLMGGILVAKAQDAWTDFKNTSISIGTEFLDWCIELPDRIEGFFVRLPDVLSKWAFESWNSFKLESIRIGTEFFDWCARLPDRVTFELRGLGTSLYYKARDAWQSFSDGTIEKWNDFRRWVSDLPRRIEVEIGDLSWTLRREGLNLVYGLWNGMMDGWDWLQRAIDDFTRGIRDGFARGLGIRSPSTVMRDEIGKWIPPGIAIGIETNLDPLKKAAAEMTLAATPELPSATGGGALAVAGPAAPVVRIDALGLPDALVEWLRNAVRTQGAGSVQGYLGQGAR